MAVNVRSGNPPNDWLVECFVAPTMKPYLSDVKHVVESKIQISTQNRRKQEQLNKSTRRYSSYITYNPYIQAQVRSTSAEISEIIQ